MTDEDRSTVRIRTAGAPGRRAEPRPVFGEGRPRAARGGALYFGLLGLIVGLLGFGLVMVLSASSVTALEAEGSAWGYFNRQLLWVGLAVIVLLVTVGVDYHRWRRMAAPLLVLSGILLVLVLVSPLAVSGGGATRWLGVGPFSLQPSELAKIAVLLFTADLLARRAHAVTDRRRVLHPVLLVTAPFLVAVLLQPDLGTAIILGTIVMSALFVAGLPLRTLGGLGAAALGGALVLGLTEGYRQARITAFLDPWADPLNSGYQTLQSLVGLASGGTSGVGLGAGRAKWGFLPNAHTDFIYAIAGEELGLIGTLTLLATFLLLGLFGLAASSRAPDRFGTIVATGITVWLLFQAVVNIGGVIGVLPITGVTLPFVSFGGSSLLVNAAAAGILCNIARQGS